MIDHCEECEEECRPVELDEGIGPFEFWGKRGHHRDMVVVSDCCEARVIRNGYVLSYEEYQADEEASLGDWLYEQERDRRMEDEMS